MPAQAAHGSEDWKAALRLPPKDTRIKTEVSWDGEDAPVPPCLFAPR